MAAHEIDDLKRILVSRLDVLGHIVDLGVEHLPDFNAALQERLAPDMFPLGAQIVLACNQPRGFAQWCAGQPVENLGLGVESLDQARSHISQTRALVAGITADDRKLDEIKRVGLGGGRYCELPGRHYVSDYIVPNLYFHITITYAILRKMGVPVGKADFLMFLAPHVRTQ